MAEVTVPQDVQAKYLQVLALIQETEVTVTAIKTAIEFDGGEPNIVLTERALPFYENLVIAFQTAQKNIEAQYPAILNTVSTPGA